MMKNMKWYQAAIADENDVIEIVVRNTEKELCDFVTANTREGWRLVGMWCAELQDGKPKVTMIE